LDSEDYWFGLYKVLISPGTYGTRWYDGNPSTYRNWASGYPKYDDVTCILYTNDGFKDNACSDKFYYTCKRSTGRSAAGPGSLITVVSVCLPSSLSADICLHLNTDDQRSQANWEILKSTFNS